MHTLCSRADCSTLLHRGIQTTDNWRDVTDTSKLVSIESLKRKQFVATIYTEGKPFAVG